jgi:hypothetical protein
MDVPKPQFDVLLSFVREDDTVVARNPDELRRLGRRRLVR